MESLTYPSPPVTCVVKHPFLQTTSRETEINSVHTQCVFPSRYKRTNLPIVQTSMMKVRSIHNIYSYQVV